MAGPISSGPARELDQAPLAARTRYDFSDYGFRLDGGLAEPFDIRLSHANDEEASLLLWPRIFPPDSGFTLFNFHCFLKKTGRVEAFARGLGPSMAKVELRPWPILGLDSIGYSRCIRMGDLFSGAPQVIDFIGGRPDLEVTDSHIYFAHRHAHFYTGMLHSAEVAADEMAALRERLLAGIRLI